MAKNTFKQHCKIITYMLSRKFPDASFDVRVRKIINEKDGLYQSHRRWLEISFHGADENNPTVKSVEYYLKRFKNGDKDRDGNIYARSFWANDKGYATLALIRKKRKDGTSTIVERYDEPEKGGPYHLARFEIQDYRVVDLDDKPYQTFDYD